MSRVLTKNEITNVLNGATLLGGGGGGSLSDGIKMLDKLPDTVTLNLIEPKEMDPDKYIGITAGMGAPSMIEKIDFTPYAVNSFNALKKLASEMDPPRTITYCMALECGGFNTFVPMLNAISLNLPYVDADGSGRAVPTLPTLLLNVNGCDTSPLGMANGNNDTVYIMTQDSKNAALCEDLGRNVCVAFGSVSGIAGWMVKQDEVLGKLVPYAVTQLETIGSIIRNTYPYWDIFSALKAKGVELKALGRGKIILKKIEEKGGFDLGTTEIFDPSTGYTWTINFQNENLIIYYTQPGHQEKIPYMTAPDIICMYDLNTGTPLTNADTEEGMEVAFGVMPVAKQWWNGGVDYAYSFWKQYIQMFGYTGPCLTYSNLKELDIKEAVADA